MQFRRLLALAALLLLGGILAACGSEDNADPTPTPAASTRITSDQTGEIPPTSTPTTETTLEAATPAASATPVTGEQESATPVDAGVVPVPASSPVAADETPVELSEISGTLTLEGRSQQDYTNTPEGCVGLGEWRQLQAGTQVVVRDASGTVVDITTLASTGTEDGCVWSFTLNVPSADFFSISIPMVTEVWFEADDAAIQGGEIKLTVP